MPSPPDDLDDDEPAKMGRPCFRVPQPIADKIGDPPDDPLELAEWASLALAQVIKLQLVGEIPLNFAASLRTSLKALSAMTPGHIRNRVGRKLKERDRSVAVDVAGPELGPPRAGKPARD